MESIDITLGDDIRETRERLSQLEMGLERKRSGDKCKPDEHILRCLNSVSGFGIEFPFKNGYQIHRCTVCDTWVAKDYTGEESREIDEATARQLI